MKNRKLIYSILVLFTILAGIFVMIIFSNRNDKLRIIFLNVGQGDAILISQGSNQVLIDGGRNGGLLLEKLGKCIPFWDRNIETIVATHPDQDHIEGLIDVLKSYQVGSVLKTLALSESTTYKKLEEEISTKKIQKIEAKKDVNIAFPGGAEINVIFPADSLPEEIDKASNEHSVVAKLVYGKNSFLFTGDLPETEENKIPADVKADILKVAHHGSKYSTSNGFLEKVQPREAIISVGKNSYGHPNQEVLQRLLQNKINISRTDEVGDIVYLCKNLNNPCVIAN